VCACVCGEGIVGVALSALRTALVGMGVEMPDGDADQEAEEKVCYHKRRNGGKLGNERRSGGWEGIVVEGCCGRCGLHWLGSGWRCLMETQNKRRRRRCVALLKMHEWGARVRGGVEGGASSALRTVLVGLGMEMPDGDADQEADEEGRGVRLERIPQSGNLVFAANFVQDPPPLCIVGQASPPSHGCTEEGVCCSLRSYTV
jgi:hypothetical protein